jgi:GTPase SAR1 family protein
LRDEDSTFGTIARALASILGFFIGLIEGIIKCSYSYFKGMEYGAYNKYSLKAKEEFNEPAKENYFFYKQYEDLKNAYYSATAINKGNILVYKKLRLEKKSIPGRFKSAQASIYVFGNIFSGICFLIHFVIITIISIPIYSLYLIIVTGEKIKSRKEKKGSICTNCYSKFNIPYYICPSCGRIHKNLVPGPYGIVNRKCNCKKLIPTTNMGGRHRLSAKCPVCSEEIENSEVPSVCISVIGGEAVGKTSFIHTSLNSLIEEGSKDISFNNIKSTDECKSLYKVFIKSKSLQSEKLLYLYDIKGENFNSINSIIRQKYYKYVDGLIFIIDPLSIDGVVNSNFIKNQDINKSININDLLDRFIIGLKKLREIEVDQIVNIPIAVVINKMELIDYDGNALDFLKVVGEEKIVRKIQYNFSSYEFFFTRNLNSASSGESCNEKQSGKPLKWILDKASN